MKKLLLLFAVMLSTLGVWAQNPELSTVEDLSNTKAYYLKSSRGSLVYNSENPDQLSSTMAYSNIDAKSENAEWAIYKAEDNKYYFYSLSGKKFIAQNSEEGGRFPLTSAPTSDIQIVASTKDGYPFVFSTDNYGAINQFNHTAAPGVANWKGNDSNGGLRALNDDGSAHSIIEVRDLTEDEISSIEDAFKYVSITYIYTFNDVERGREKFEKVVVGANFPNASEGLLPYGVVATVSGKVSESDDASEKNVILTTDLPFVAASEPGSITRWYYMKMHSNNRKYIQNINEEYLEWADGEMDLTSIDSYAWGFVGNPFDGFKMVNKASGLDKAVLSTGSGNPSMTAYADATAFVYSKTNENVSGGFCMKYPSSGQYLNAQSGKVAHWGSADAGSTFMIERALPVQLTTNDAPPFYYALKSGRPGEFWYTYDSSDGMIYLGANTGEDTQLWFFKGLYQDGKLCVQLYPKADPTKAMSYQNTNNDPAKIVAQVPGTEGWKNTWKFVDTNGAAPYGLRTPGDETYLSNNGGTGNKMGMWNSSPADDTGTAIYIYQTIDNIITDMAGNTYESTSFAQVGQLPEPAAFTGVAGYTLSNKCWVDNKFTADIDFGFPVSSESTSTDNWTVMKQGSWSGSVKKWHVVNDGGIDYVKVQTKTATHADVTEWLWAIYPLFDNGAFTFKIKNYATATYVTANTEVTGDFGGSNKPISLSATPTSFTVESRSAGKMFAYMAGADLNSKHYLTINSTNDTDVFLGSYTGGHSGNDVNFPPISYTASITSAKAATLYTPVAVTIPEGVTAKYVKAEGENMNSTGKLVYTKLNNVIPANSAVVLTGEAGNYTFTATTEAGEEVADNVLFGYALSTAVSESEHATNGKTGTVYALSNIDDKIAFYHFVGDTYKAGKAYLDVAPLLVSGVRYFVIFDEDMETAIEGVEAVDTKSEIYDLAGRRVQNAQKGVFIVNGKVVIK